tara:strand:- start:590 stop:1132 length:543 start_codon:yes stop_codon:yes gene_type:complete
MKTYSNCISLSGKNRPLLHNLKGINYINSNGVPSEIREFKMTIMNNLIVPLIKKQWGTVYNNLFRIEAYRKKMNYLIKRYPKYDIELYNNIITLIYSIHSEHIELEDLEKKIFKTDDTATLAYKTTRIRLKAEYELYNLILGAPSNGDKYNDSILAKISKLLQDDHNTIEYITHEIRNVL